MLSASEKKKLTGIAALGRNEDNQLVHVAKGEMVVPPVIRPETRQMVETDMKNVGLNPQEYEVGNSLAIINPNTGLPEFGFLSKVFKKVKNAVKKVAKVALPAAVLIPGVGQALGAVGGSLLGKVGLGNVASGIGSFVGSIPGMGNVGTAITAGSGGGLGSALTFGKDAITSGIGSMFSPKGIMSQVMRGGMPAGQQMPNMMPTGGFIRTSGGDSANDFLNQFQPNSYREINGRGFILGKDGQMYPADQVKSQYAALMGQSQGSFFGGKTPGFIKGIGDAIGLGGRSGLEDVYGPNVQEGSFFGRRTPGFIRGIEDVLKSPFQTPDDGRGPIIDPAIAALAIGYGKLNKEAAERASGGMQDVRQSIRPDLAQPQTFGGNMGFDVGVRRFADGGQAEKVLDMRQGGESEGPGTGTSDDIPAMLSDGEFVMTAKAVRGIGAFTVKTGKDKLSMNVSGKPSREKGADNMMKLMKTFENYG
tara:strand:+ start:1575 stop:3005 length:1431 start_codon:yes stop_codon:yes gene_type:complete